MAITPLPELRTRIDVLWNTSSARMPPDPEFATSDNSPGVVTVIHSWRVIRILLKPGKPICSAPSFTTVDKAPMILLSPSIFTWYLSPGTTTTWALMLLCRPVNEARSRVTVTSEPSPWTIRCGYPEIATQKSKIERKASERMAADFNGNPQIPCGFAMHLKIKTNQ